ncbi:MAG: hydantoinase B/oxoprolinase family protein [Candidatus Bathyarchaeota archaeon]|nr:MAG: hydantoinase B/oxoprolinase family protein [Candidatus Bathyarchaeota archaeon]
MTPDPVTVEVIRGALTYASEEMGIALRNAAYSPNIKERMDCSCTIFDHKQRLAAQAEHIPVHLGSMIFAVQEGLKYYRGTLEDGDMILLNDPYISGTHLPDITLISPILIEGELVGFAANKAHHSDVGGKAPGSMAADATDLSQEGFIIPPVKFVDAGVIDEDLVNLILSNVRTPDVRMGDLRAQIAANLMGEQKVVEIVERYGVDTYHDAVETIMNRSELMMRSEIAKMPKGRFEAEDFLEDTGIHDEPVRIRVAITVHDDTVKIDYTGTHNQVDAPINAVWGVTLSGVYYTLKCITNPAIPTNDGYCRPIKVYAPKGTILNPTRPAPVAGGNVETSQRNVDVLMKACARLVPERVCAACQGTMNNISVGGADSETGKAWSFYETVAGGFGGRYGFDGIDAIHTHMTNTMNTPIEAIEQAYPIRVLAYELRRDGGGPGRWRGGVGITRSWQLLAPSATLSILAERVKIPPWGLFRGRPGALGEYLLKKPDGRTIKLKSKSVVTMRQGDTLLIKTPGGGGYGDPLERDPELVLIDVINELVSLKSARTDYGVIIDSKPMRIDLEATKQLRTKMREIA